MTQIYTDQVSVASLVTNTIYASGTVGAILIVAGLLLADAGTVRRRNLLNSMAEKFIGFFIGALLYYIVGFALWASQFYIMQGGTLGDAIADWWLGGSLMRARAQHVSPEVFPALNDFQIFVFFLACFAGIINVLLHFSVSERMKPAAYFICAAVASVVSSALSALTWGPVGLLTNPGFHDFFGVGFVYLFTAGMGVTFAYLLGPRPGMFAPNPQVSSYLAPQPALAVTGVALIFAGLPMVILSCLFFFQPGEEPALMAVSITMADTSVGLAFNNYMLGWTGGAITGAIIAYVTKKYAYVLLGPLSGYVAGAAAYDIYSPLQTLIVCAIAPLVSYLIYEFTQKRQIDEHKLIPLFLGGGVYGLLVVGIVKAGTPRGGYFGITEGAYAFQHATVSFGMQLVGVIVCMGLGVVTALILWPILSATVGVKNGDAPQIEGLDKHFWDIEPDVPTYDGAPAAHKR